MKIGFRVDSSPEIGIGHLHRSIEFAKEFKNAGIKVFFYTANLNGNIDYIIKEKGFSLVQLNKNKVKLKKLRNNFLKADAIKTSKFLKKDKISLIIVDNYLINEKWERHVSKYCKLALIDDFVNRKTFCDYIISYHLSKRSTEKFLVKKNCLRLEDSQYTIIKKYNKKKEYEKKLKNVLVYFGGADNRNFTKILFNKFNSKLYKKFQFSFILSSKKFAEIKKKNLLNKNIKFKTKVSKDLYSEAKKNSLVLSNMGLSMYEFAHAGKKLILFPQSNTHRKIAQNLREFQIFKIISHPNELNKKTLINGFLESKDVIKKRMSIFNSLGSKALVNFFLKKFQKLRLEKFKENDKYFLHKLVNDPAVRASSIKSKKNINFDDHSKWLEKFKKKKKNLLLIFKTDHFKLGQIRLEKSKNYYNLDYSISNEFRNNGFGAKMIRLAIKEYKLSKIRAVAKKKNISSNKTLQKVGFKKISNTKTLNNYLFSL